MDSRQPFICSVAQKYNRMIWQDSICCWPALISASKSRALDWYLPKMPSAVPPQTKGIRFETTCQSVFTRNKIIVNRFKNRNSTIIFSKELSHEIDFDNFDKNWRMLALVSAVASFWIFRRSLWFLVEIKHPLSGKCYNHADSCCCPINFVPELPASLSY